LKTELEGEGLFEIELEGLTDELGDAEADGETEADGLRQSSGL